MTFAQPATKAFDPKAIAKSLHKSRAHDHQAWRNHLLGLSEDQRYYIQKEFLQRYPPAEFEGWFNFSAMVTHLSRDPLLASLHNPNLWLYAFTHSSASPIMQSQVLHAYWSSIALMRPSEHFEPQLMASIHEAVSRAVAFLEEDKHPWTTGLTPAVLSCPEEAALIDVPRDKMLAALTAYVLQYRDVGSLKDIPMAYPMLTVILAVMDMGCFPERYQTSALPWPTPEKGEPWSDDLRLSLHAVSIHPKMRHWWALPNDAVALPEHLSEAVLMLDIGVQLGYLATIKDWISAQ